jgi:hypothetical protein
MRNSASAEIHKSIQLIGPYRGKTNYVLLNDIFVCLLSDTIAKTAVTMVTLVI